MKDNMRRTKLKPSAAWVAYMRICQTAWIAYVDACNAARKAYTADKERPNG